MKLSDVVSQLKKFESGDYFNGASDFDGSGNNSMAISIANKAAQGVFQTMTVLLEEGVDPEADGEEIELTQIVGWAIYFTIEVIFKCRAEIES